MDSAEVRRLWNKNAEGWTVMARQGYDLYRDRVNTPAFLEMLPDVNGLRGLDIGCGEGHNTRLLAERGAHMTAFDLAPRFVRQARAEERRLPKGIAYVEADAASFPFRSTAFDFLTGFMSFMDIPQHPRLIAEAFRVLEPGGFLQFSISHPCFFTPRWEWARDAEGRRVGIICGDYFGSWSGTVEEWTFGAAPPEVRDRFERFQVPRFPETLSGWMNLLVAAGFVLERFGEPHADEETAAAVPHVADTRVIAYFLHVRCRKPKR